MKLKICLAKKLLIFYSVLAPFFIIGSVYNLIGGVILNKNPTVSIGAFSLFGFIIFPIVLVVTYLNNKCIIHSDKMSIGKVDYKFSDYNFSIREKELAFKHRPIISPFKKNYYDLVIEEMKTGRVVFETDLDVFQKDIEKIRYALPLNGMKLN